MQDAAQNATARVSALYSTSTRLGGVGLAEHAYHAVLALWQRGWLRRAVVCGNRQRDVPRRYVRCIRFHPGKLLSFTPARFYYGMKMEYVDWVTSRLVGGGCDLFHGWSNEAFRTLHACRRRGAVSILEIPGPHYHWAMDLVAADAARRGAESDSRPKPYAFGLLDYFPNRLRRVDTEYELADRILLESEFARETFVQRGVPAHKLRVVSPGADVERFRPAAEPPGRFRAVFVGSLCFRKGVHYLLEAWEQLRLPDAELLLVGNPHAEVAELIARHDGRNGVRNIRHTDPVPLYQQASVFVFPSLIEGSAKVTYEAMASGLPVILTPNAGSVARDGVEGYLVPAQDPEMLAARILDLYREPARRREMGRAARRRAESYTWAHHRARLLEAYAEALGTAGRPAGTLSHGTA